MTCHVLFCTLLSNVSHLCRIIRCQWLVLNICRAKGYGGENSLRPNSFQLSLGGIPELSLGLSVCLSTHPFISIQSRMKHCPQEKVNRLVSATITSGLVPITMRCSRAIFFTGPSLLWLSSNFFINPVISQQFPSPQSLLSSSEH